MPRRSGRQGEGQKRGDSQKQGAQGEGERAWADESFMKLAIGLSKSSP